MRADARSFTKQYEQLEIKFPSGATFLMSGQVEVVEDVPFSSYGCHVWIDGIAPPDQIDRVEANGLAEYQDFPLNLFTEDEATFIMSEIARQHNEDSRTQTWFADKLAEYGEC